MAILVSLCGPLLSRKGNCRPSRRRDNVFGMAFGVHVICMPGSYLPVHSEIIRGIVNLDHGFVPGCLPVPSSDAATAREPPTPHHGSELIDEEQAMNDRQREADTPPVGLEFGVIAAHETEMALREVPVVDYVYKSMICSS